MLDVTSVIERITRHLVRHVEELSHIDPDRILFTISHSRSGGVGGTYARIHPLRFEGGASVRIVTRGRKRFRQTMPAITHRGVEVLYLVTFLVPRFLNLSPREKLATIVHELYHVSPRFDGDIRRFAGRNHAHGPSRAAYNRTVDRLVDACIGDPTLLDLLVPIAPPLVELKARHGAIVGRRIPVPRIRIEEQ